MRNSSNSSEDFSLRPYQREGADTILRDLMRHARGLTSESLGEEVSNRVRKIHNFRMSEPVFRVSDSTALADMTMGSGKTLVLGEFLRRIFRLRNRHAPTKRLNILVLSDRINLVDQLEWDLVSGRDGQPGMIHREIFPHGMEPNVQRIHSQNLKKELGLQDQQDNIVFSTIQSVGSVGWEWDIIIVDEADSVLASWNREAFVWMADSQKNAPYILGLTGTVDAELIELLGEPIFSYGLDEYLRSPYAPDIDYHLMTANRVTKEEIVSIHALISEAQNEKGIPRKRKMEKMIRKEIEKVLARFDGYASVVHHLLHDSGIDLSARTLLFVPSIDEANEVARLLNEELEKKGFPYRAKALHSQTDENDLDVLNEYRSDNGLSILVTVNKLNRWTDIPTIENIISLRDTKSKRVYLQQIGRGMRGDLARIFDYTPSLANLIWIRDVLFSKASGGHGGKHGDGIGQKWQGFMLWANTAYVDQNLVDFFWLISFFVKEDSAKKRLLVAEDWIDALEKHWVKNGNDLIEKGCKWFNNAFGRKDLWNFLGKTINSVTPSDLMELVGRLGWEVELNQKASLWTTKEEVIETLAKYGIRNGEDLGKMGAKWFQNTFRRIELWVFLGRSLKFISIRTLKELAEKLGWDMDLNEKEKLGTTKEEILLSLAKQGVHNGEDLKIMWPIWFFRIFWRTEISLFLQKPLEYATFDILKELAEKLGWDMLIEWKKLSIWTTKEEIIQTLLEFGISDGDLLYDKGAKWVQNTFWIKDLWVFFGRSLTVIAKRELLELCEKLWWKTTRCIWTSRETIISALAHHGITNGEELKKKWPKWFQSTFWIRDLWKFLGKTIERTVSYAHLKELADKLGWELDLDEKKENLGVTKDEILLSLAKHGITNRSQLDEKWPVWFYKTFWLRDLIKFLNKSILGGARSSDLDELAEMLWWAYSAWEKLGTTKEEIIFSLCAHGIRNGDDLKNKGSEWFNKTFWIGDIGKFLDRKVRAVRHIELKELAEKIGWNMEASGK